MSVSLVLLVLLAMIEIAACFLCVNSILERDADPDASLYIQSKRTRLVKRCEILPYVLFNENVKITLRDTKPVYYVLGARSELVKEDVKYSTQDYFNAECKNDEAGDT